MKSPQTLSPDQQSAIPEILDLLGLKHAPLLQLDMIALCDRFHSLPHARRKNVTALARHLDLALLCLDAMRRVEVTATVARSPALQKKLDDVYATVEALLSGYSR